MTFLLFVCHELLGPSAYGSCWHCPWCDTDGESKWVSFSVRPPKRKPGGGQYRIYFRCHRCGEWGDEFKLVRHVLGLSYRAAELYLNKLLERYVNEQAGNSPLGEDGGANPKLVSTKARRLAKKLARSVARRQSYSPNGEGKATRSHANPD